MNPTTYFTLSSDAKHSMMNCTQFCFQIKLQDELCKILINEALSRFLPEFQVHSTLLSEFPRGSIGKYFLHSMYRCLHTICYKPNFYHGSQVFPIDIIQGLSKDFCTPQPENLWLFTTRDLKITSNLDGRKSAYVVKRL